MKPTGECSTAGFIYITMRKLIITVRVCRLVRAERITNAHANVVYDCTD